MGTKTAHLIAQLTDKVSGPAAQMAAGLKKAADQADALTRLSAKGGTGKLAADLRNLGASASQIDAVTAAMKRYAAQNMIPANRADWTKVQASQMRTWENSTVASLKHVIAAEREAAQAAREFASAQLAAAVKAGEAARKQRQAAMEQAKAHREAIRERRRDAAATIASGAGVVAAHKGKKIGLDAVSSAAEFDIAVRKQREFTDINAQIQAGLLAQAKRVGQETQFSNIDVVKAQTASMQGLPAGFGPELKAAVAEGIVENVRNFATLMETDLKDGAETIRSYLQATGKDISTKEKALAEANRATNQMVKMAKLGGMSGEDVAQFVKYAAASSTSAGLTTDSLLSLGALARRGGLRGDEAGVFMRATANKLVSPTKKGLAAYNAAGIDHSSFVKMPDRLSTSALEGQFRLDMGKGFTPAIRKRIDRINADKTLLADQGRYVAAVTSAVEPMLGKKKNGQVRASDRQVAAKAAGNYYKVGAQSVDTEGLLDALMKANPTLAQLNAILTDKHGGKGAITQRQWDEFKASREEIKKSGDDPDYAAKKAKVVMGGLGGSVENLKGSWENFVLNVGEANSDLIKATADKLGSAVDQFSKLDKGTQQALSLGAGGAALAGGAYGAFNLTKALLGFGGSSVALNGSAAALTASAAALDAAAVALGGKGVAGGAASAAAGTAAGAGGGALASLGLFGIGAGTIAAAGFAGYTTAQTMPKVAAEKGATGIDPATGGALPSNPMEGLSPSRPFVQDWWRKHMPTILGGDAVKPEVDASQVEALDQKLGAAKDKADELSATTFAPKLEAAGLDAFTSGIHTAKGTFTELGEMTANPTIGMGSVNAFNAGLREGLSLLAKLKAEAASMPSPNVGGGARTGKVSTARSGAFSDTGMG